MEDLAGSLKQFAKFTREENKLVKEEADKKNSSEVKWPSAKGDDKPNRTMSIKKKEEYVQTAMRTIEKYITFDKLSMGL